MLFRSFLKNWALWMSTEKYYISKDEKRSFFVKSVYLLIKSMSISNVEDPSTVVWCRLLLENDFSFICPRKIIVKKASILVTHHYFFAHIVQWMTSTLSLRTFRRTTFNWTNVKLYDVGRLSSKLLPKTRYYYATNENGKNFDERVGIFLVACTMD